MFAMPLCRVLCAFAIVFCAIQGGCHYADHHVIKGVEIQGEGELEAAIEKYNRAIDVNPDFALAYYNRACAEREMGNLESALADFAKAILIDPYSVAAFVNRADLKIRMGNLEGAVNDYSQALRIAPDKAIIFYNRGIVRERMKDYAAAIRDYEKAASLSPELASKAHQRIAFCRNRLRFSLFH